MGTNYYVTEEEPCPHCGRGGELRHIGKSSAGWCFSLRVYPEEGINTLDDWKEFWAGKAIEDEYGDPVTEEEMLKRITERGRDGDPWAQPPHPIHRCSTWEQFFARNHCDKGPNGMLRHRIDGNVVGHGEGTWDYVTGEFC
jgi:hypothetical protein